MFFDGKKRATSTEEKADDDLGQNNEPNAEAGIK
jgi:hypothetical protein